MSEEYIEWTKRLGQRHYAKAGSSNETLCGRPMLGNNYADIILDDEKTDCDECVSKMTKEAFSEDV